jgi:iron complex outermembrane receptor protein
VLSASIRGIGQDDFAFNLDPGVGVYLDGVYLARTIGANQSLLDIDRIEILKGPQGTLFGRNTIGGAISIVTHRPGDKAMFTAASPRGSFNRRTSRCRRTFRSRTSSSPRELLFLAARGLPEGHSVPDEQRTRPGAVCGGSADRLPKAATPPPDTKGGQDQQVVRGKALWRSPTISK